MATPETTLSALRVERATIELERDMFADQAEREDIGSFAQDLALAQASLCETQLGILDDTIRVTELRVARRAVSA